jgi:hypothetical protein
LELSQPGQPQQLLDLGGWGQLHAVTNFRP